MIFVNNIRNTSDKIMITISVATFPITFTGDSIGESPVGERNPKSKRSSAVCFG